MKTILVLTDFSENALKAAEAAAMLCGKFNANLLLLYANYAVPAIPYYPGVIMVNENISWEEECEEKLNQLALHLQKIVSEGEAKGHKLSINKVIREGNLWDNVKDVLKKEKIEMVVMGGRSGSNIDHIVFGSDTSKIIDHISCPVLIVSSGFPVRKIDRIAFAAGFYKSEADAIKHLLNWSKLFQFQLEIVHVRLYGDRIVPEDPHLVDFIKELGDKNYPNVIYREIRGKSLMPRLLNFCREREVDMLAFTHQQHSYLARILKEGTVKKVIARQKLPLLVFPTELLHKNNPKERESLTGYIL